MELELPQTETSQKYNKLEGAVARTEIKMITAVIEITWGFTRPVQEHLLTGVDSCW